MTNIDIVNFFIEPLSARQRQYEAVRAIFVDKISYESISKKFGYKLSTLYSIVRNVKSGKLNLFPEVQKGPRQRITSKEIQNRIINYRKRENLSTIDISQKFKEEGINISQKTIERILVDAGFKKLKRRTYKERGITPKGKIIPERSENLNFEELEPFKTDCPCAGAFLLLPYIIESDIIDIVKKCKLPSSSVIGSTQACLSMLLLKLIGNERLSNIGNYDQEPGLGIFAGLNILPKVTYMNTYSCRTSDEMLLDFQKQILNKFKLNFSELYGSDFINLDFHSIPHYGENIEMEKVWCGSKHTTMRGANTVFAQDTKNNMILYTRADILRSEESEEIKKFVEYWREINGDVNETLVFDCKFTKYDVLNQLNKEGIKFITLKKRYYKLLQSVKLIPKEEWTKVFLNPPKRKHKKVSVHESEITLGKCKEKIRQIIIKDHGREQPTFIITNNGNLTIKQIVEVYAKRWRVENKLSELISFFNLNALSSPLMIRIHFDILWTFIADSLYHIFAKDLRRFEHHDAKTIFKKFINMPGQVCYDGKSFAIKIRKRSHTPILKSVDKLKNPFVVPWLANKKIEIIWTA